MASGLNTQTEEFQVNAFMYAAGDDAEGVMNMLTLTEEQKGSYKALTDAFAKYCVSKRNVIFERARFNRRVQEPGESVESFLTAVHALAEHCEFGTLRDQLIRDRIVVGIRDGKLSENLQLDAKLTLESAITKVRQSDAVKKQQPVMRGTEPVAGNLEAIHKRQSRGPARVKGSAKDHPATDQGSACGRCGNAKHLWKDCPARDAECRRCHKKGHFAKKCKSKGGVHNITEERTDGVEGEDYFYLSEMASGGNSEWNELLKLNGKKTVFKLDTGAAVTAIPGSAFFPNSHGALQPARKVLYGPGNHKLEVRGCFKGLLSIENRETEQDIYVIVTVKASVRPAGN